MSVLNPGENRSRRSRSVMSREIAGTVGFFFPWDRWSDRSLRQPDVASVKIKSDMAPEPSRVRKQPWRVLSEPTGAKNPQERASVIRNLRGGASRSCSWAILNLSVYIKLAIPNAVVIIIGSCNSALRAAKCILQPLCMYIGTSYVLNLPYY